MINLEFDQQSWVSELDVKGECPDCKTLLVARCNKEPFANTPNLIVIPLECPSCNFTLVLHVQLASEPDKIMQSHHNAEDGYINEDGFQEQ